jgi:hypothetical protein
MNHDYLPPRRPTQARSGRYPGDPTRRATFRRLVGILNVSGATTILLWTLFSQDITAGACNFYTGDGCNIPRPCTTSDGRPGLSVGGGPCVPFPPNSECGIIEPKYFIPTVIYIPPGKKGSGGTSSVQYKQSITTGTTVSTSRTFKREFKISASAETLPAAKIGVEAKGTYSTSRNTKDSTKVDVKRTLSMSDAIEGPRVDGFNYDRDIISVSVKPQVKVCISRSGQEGQWALVLPPDQVADIQDLTVAELKDPTTIHPDVAKHFADFTPDDFQQILLTAHPLAVGLPFDTSRYALLNAENPFRYQPGGVATRKYTEQVDHNRLDCSARESSYSVGYSIKTSGVFPGLFKTTLQNELTWTWTHGFETCTSAGTSQSAEIGLVSPSSEYSGPTLLGVAYDTFFQTFAFVPAGPGGRVAVAGTVRDVSRRPVSGLEVLLYANGTTYRTFTDEQGLYEFSGDFVGSMEVATRGVPKQPVPQVEGIAIVDLIRPVEIPLPLQPAPWVPQPPAHLPVLSPRCQELLVGQNCGTSSISCISLRIPVGGTCQGECAESTADSLRAEGITVLGPSGNLPEQFPPACVGFRPDIGGTAEGAQCLVDFLGPPYQLEDLQEGENCRVDGFPYNVYLE